jgi:hypothetical protein
MTTGLFFVYAVLSPESIRSFTHACVLLCGVWCCFLSASLRFFGAANGDSSVSASSSEPPLRCT